MVIVTLIGPNGKKIVNIIILKLYICNFNGNVHQHLKLFENLTISYNFIVIRANIVCDSILQNTRK